MLVMEKKKQRRLFKKDDLYHLFYLLYILWSNFYSSLFLLNLRGKEGITGIAERQYGYLKSCKSEGPPNSEFALISVFPSVFGICL